MSALTSRAPSQELPEDLARKLQACRDTIERLGVLQQQVDRELQELRGSDGVMQPYAAWPALRVAAVSVLQWISNSLLRRPA